MENQKALTENDLPNLRVNMVVYATQDIYLISGKVPAGTRGKITQVVKNSHWGGLNIRFDNGVVTFNPIPLEPKFLTREKPVREENEC